MFHKMSPILQNYYEIAKIDVVVNGNKTFSQRLTDDFFKRGAILATGGCVASSVFVIAC